LSRAERRKKTYRSRCRKRCWKSRLERSWKRADNDARVQSSRWA
jgi:hypothetical protein